MIPITKTFLPPIDEYRAILQRAWDKSWITNRGELVQELEHLLSGYCGVPHLTLTTNGTLPIQLALKTLPAGSEVITTPFSYVATTSAIVWEGLRPVFIDIHPEYLTIDETRIEEKIGPNTSAILATHVFGNPCHTEPIRAIPRRHGLTVIYDAAHAFGVTYKGRSLLQYGDISTCSFHATKIFHCGEGGAMLCHDPQLHHTLFYRHNFGHNGPLDFHGLGINAKMSELQAAMGLAVWPYLDEIMDSRRKLAGAYRERLDGTGVQTLRIRPDTEWNHSYFPVLLKDEPTLLRILEKLNAEDIFPRRYFYPSLNTIGYVAGEKMAVSESVAGRILCLPMYLGLEEDTVQKICDLIGSHAGR